METDLVYKPEQIEEDRPASRVSYLLSDILNAASPDHVPTEEHEQEKTRTSYLLSDILNLSGGAGDIADALATTGTAVARYAQPRRSNQGGDSDAAVLQHFANIESSGGDYTAQSSKSSAYGKYQFVKETLAEQAKKLGMSIAEARTPEGQERIMAFTLNGYKRALDANGIPKTKENLFALHNLGVTGGLQVLKGDFNRHRVAQMRKNVEDKYVNAPANVVIKRYLERFNIKPRNYNL